MQVANQVGQENQAPGQNSNYRQRAALVIGLDLAGQVGNPFLNFRLTDQDVHPGEPSVPAGQLEKAVHWPREARPHIGPHHGRASLPSQARGARWSFPTAFGSGR